MTSSDRFTGKTDQRGSTAPTGSPVQTPGAGTTRSTGTTPPAGQVGGLGNDRAPSAADIASPDPYAGSTGSRSPKPGKSSTKSQAGNETKAGEKSEKAALRDSARQTADTLKSAARDTASAVRTEGAGFAEQARQTVGDLANRKKDTVAGELEGFSNALSKAATNFSQESGLPVDQYLQTAASSVNSLSQTLRQSDASELITKLERVTRENPVAVLGGAAFLGFLAARFLRSSSEHLESGSRTGGSGYPVRSSMPAYPRTPGSGTQVDSGAYTDSQTRR